MAKKGRTGNLGDILKISSEAGASDKIKAAQNKLETPAASPEARQEAAPKVETSSEGAGEGVAVKSKAEPKPQAVKKAPKIKAGSFEAIVTSYEPKNEPTVPSKTYETHHKIMKEISNTTGVPMQDIAAALLEHVFMDLHLKEVKKIIQRGRPDLF